MKGSKITPEGVIEMRILLTMLLMAVLTMGVAGAAMADPPPPLPSMPPFPGIDPQDINATGSVYGISPTISPRGFLTVFRGTQFPVTISRIDILRPTVVVLAERLPDGRWTLYNLSGWYPNGNVTVNFFAGMRGLHFLIAWVDNNHNGAVDLGELTIPWLAVLVSNRGSVSKSGATASKL